MKCSYHFAVNVQKFYLKFVIDTEVLSLAALPFARAGLALVPDGGVEAVEEDGLH